jgi:DNA-binding transcriptional regulator YhcF (GntR family)
MDEFVDFITLDISENSKVPKYKQIADSIAAKVERGSIRSGQKLPSINQLSTYYLLSRDTVEKAYALLKEKNMIESTPGVGYYISSKHPDSKLKVILLFNKLSAYKKVIYDQLAEKLRDKAYLSLHVYHCDFGLFKQIMEENLEGYHYYILMPHFSEYDPRELSKVVSKVPEDKIIVIDNLIKGIDSYFGCVYQNYLEDIFNALQKLNDKLKAYQKMVLVFPDNNTYPYPYEIVQGFTKFCLFNAFDYEIISSIKKNHKVKKGNAYVLISESDLSNLIKLCRMSDFELGMDVGVISYNETVLKEVLGNGITVMSTDFDEMGKFTAQMILDSQPIKHKNEFRLILRNSL